MVVAVAGDAVQRSTRVRSMPSSVRTSPSSRARAWRRMNANTARNGEARSSATTAITSDSQAGVSLMTYRMQPGAAHREQ